MPTLLLETSYPLTGDMLVGLLCDLGVKPSTFEWELGKVDLGGFHLHLEERGLGEVQGVHFGVHAGAVHTHDQDADEGTPHHTHVHGRAEDDEAEGLHGHHSTDESQEDLEDDLTAKKVRDILDASELDDALKARVLAVFDQFCVHEGNVLGAAPHDLTFDEDSALTISAQIICACTGLAEMRIDTVIITKPVDDSVAAGILAVYQGTDEASASPLALAKSGYGIGDEGWVRGVLA